MRHLLILGVIALSVFSLSSSSIAAPQEEKEWTLLVYLNGNNSLDDFGPTNIVQMQKIGSTDKVNVVVQWASLKAGTTKRLLVKQDTTSTAVTSPTIQDMGKVDMGDYNSLIDFVHWGVQNFPAKHYFIDVWDHGGGLHLDSTSKPLDISWDDSTGHFFTIPQLGLALKDAAKTIGHKVDLYGSDACLMAMPEISNEMADSVSVFAGSEETEPGAGWPYTELLKGWNDLEESSALNVSKLLTDSYVDSYRGGSNGTEEVTFSTFDLSKTSAINKAMTDLGQNISGLSDASKAKVVTAITGTQTFIYNDFGDLGDFIKNLKSANIDGVKADVVSEVEQALSQFITANRSTPGSYARATGASIWLPSTKDTLDTYWSKYEPLQFQQTTHWGDALKSLFK